MFFFHLVYTNSLIFDENMFDENVDEFDDNIEDRVLIGFGIYHTERSVIGFGR